MSGSLVSHVVSWVVFRLCEFSEGVEAVQALRQLAQQRQGGVKEPPTRQQQSVHLQHRTRGNTREA